jgi:hypothetical protein
MNSGERWAAQRSERCDGFIRAQQLGSVAPRACQEGERERCSACQEQRTHTIDALESAQARGQVLRERRGSTRELNVERLERTTTNWRTQESDGMGERRIG